MNDSKQSVKHHFIPQFYLKGFADKNDNLFLYNKEFKKINRSPKKTSQIFYENNLHTVTLFGEKTVLIEETYSKFEDKFSKIINMLEGLPSNDLNNLSKYPEWVKILTLMISIQFWRNPQRHRLAQLHCEKLLELYDAAILINKDVIPFDRKEVKYFFKGRENKQKFKFIQYLIFPLISFKLDGHLQDDFIIVRTADFDYQHDFVCTDNPICFDHLSDKFVFTGHFYYPLSKNLILTTKSENYDFDKIQKKLISNANNIVVASSISLLENFFHTSNEK